MSIKLPGCCHYAFLGLCIGQSPLSIGAVLDEDMKKPSGLLDESITLWLVTVKGEPHPN